MPPAIPETLQQAHCLWQTSKFPVSEPPTHDRCTSCLTCLPSALMVSLSAAAWGVAMMVFRTPLVQMRSSLRSKMFRVWQYRSRRGCRLPGFSAYTTCGGEHCYGASGGLAWPGGII